MKKNHSLLKVILITFLVFVVLSWFIGGGLFYKGTFYKADSSSALGLGDIFSLPFQAFYLFAEYGIIFLIIGGLYGVLNKTGVYHNIIKTIAGWFKKKKNLAIILSALLIMAFESIIGSSILTFVLIPFFAVILTELGFTKKRVMFATIGALIIGSFASLTGFGGIINYLLEISKKSLLKVRIIIFFITSIIMAVTLVLKDRYDDDTEMMEFKYEEGSKKGFGLVIILAIFMIIAIIGVYNFKEYLGIGVFANLSEKLAKIKLFNGVTAFGSWGVKDIAGLMLFTIVTIAIAYRIKFSELVEGFKEGVKPMIRVSFYATLAGLIFMYYYNSDTGYNFIDKIVNSIYNSSSEYLAFKTAIATPLYTVLLNNQLFLANNVAAILVALSTNKTTLASSGLSLQLMSGISNLIIPTSYILMAGLAYYDISYGKWFKYIWKVLIVLILIAGIIILA